MNSPLPNLSKYKLILASQSPRRKELLGKMGLSFQVKVLPNIDESYPKDLPALDVAEYLSNKKAQAYVADLQNDELIITADTVVICDDEILGKPETKSEALDMLQRLSGKTHLVVSGVSLRAKGIRHSFSTTTKVSFEHLSEEEINHYVDQFKPYDKAGAYGIQEWIGHIGVKHIEGSYFNVMGLPVQKLYQVLKQLR